MNGSQTAPPPHSGSPVLAERQNQGISHTILSVLRWLLFVPIGLIATNLSANFVYWIAAIMDSFLPPALDGLIATRVSLVVVLPLIAGMTVGAAFIAPIPKIGVIVYAVCLAGIRTANVVYADGSIFYAILFYAPVLYGVYAVLNDTLQPTPPNTQPPEPA